MLVCVPNGFQGHIVKNGRTRRFSFLSSQCPANFVFVLAFTSIFILLLCFFLSILRHLKSSCWAMCRVIGLSCSPAALWEQWLLLASFTSWLVGSWHRLVNVALIPRFLDAGWRGWPPRFHTVVTCAHRAVWCGLGIFPSTSSVILSDCGRAAARSR